MITIAAMTVLGVTWPPGSALPAEILQPITRASAGAEALPGQLALSSKRKSKNLRDKVEDL
jgi:hypothetical protein